MNTPTTPHPSALTFEGLVTAIGQAHVVLAQQATKAVNISLTLRNWAIGFYIAEFELQGANRAAYGDRLILELVAALRTQNVSNVSRRQLYAYLAFYRAYPQIVQTASAQSTHLFPLAPPEKKVRSLTALSKIELSISPEKLISELSYTHFEQLVELQAPLKRRFYEVETLRGNWSVRELKRQIDTQYFERSTLSANKDRVSQQLHATAEQQPLRLALPNRTAWQRRNRRIPASCRARINRAWHRMMTNTPATAAPMNSSLRASCTGPAPHTDLEPVSSSRGRRPWRSMSLGVMDCFTAFAMTVGSWKTQRGNPTPWRTELLAGLPIIMGLAIRQH